MPDDRDGAHDDTLTAAPEVTPGPRHDAALASFQAGLARAEQQAKADPSNPAWTAAATRLRATIATRH